jgi:hypothetical protein
MPGNYIRRALWMLPNNSSRIEVLGAGGGSTTNSRGGVVQEVSYASSVVYPGQVIACFVAGNGAEWWN